MTGNCFGLSACMLSVAHSCPTLCNLIDHHLPGSTVHGISQARRLEWVAHALLQGNFPTQGLNPSLLCFWHWHMGSLPLVPPRTPLI